MQARGTVVEVGRVKQDYLPQKLMWRRMGAGSWREHFVVVVVDVEGRQPVN